VKVHSIALKHGFSPEDCDSSGRVAAVDRAPRRGRPTDGKLRLCFDTRRAYWRRWFWFEGADEMVIYAMPVRKKDLDLLP